MRRYGIAGPVSGELLRHRGRVLVHDDRAELEFLLADARVVEVPDWITPEETMPISQHPDMASVQWPLQREHFR